MLPDKDIEEFKKKARAAGYTEAQIASEIQRKKQELASQSQPKPDTPLPTANSTTKKSKDTKPIERQKPGGAKGALDTAANFLFPRAQKLGRKVVGSLTAGKRTDQAEETNKQLQEQAQLLLEKAKKESDPVKKRKLLDQVRELNQAAVDSVDQILSEFESSTGLDRNLTGEPSALTEGLGIFGEGVTAGLPVGRVGKGAGIVRRILRAGATGATVGAIQGATTPQDLSLEDRLKEAGKGGLAGATISGTLEGVTGVPRGLVRNFVKGNNSRIYRLFRITPSERAKFRKSTGNMDFAEELIARDAKGMAGKNHEELLAYFSQRKKQAYRDVESVLAESTETINKADLEKRIQAKIKSLAPSKGNVGQGGAVSALQTTLDELKEAPDQLSLSVANNIKRQLQDAGDAAFSPTGKATPSSKALAEVSSYVNDLIEKKSPGAKERNRLVQLYETARRSIEKTGDREANKISNDIAGKFLQTLPATIGLGTGLITGSPYAGMGSLIAVQLLSGGVGAARVKYFTPEVQTSLVNRLLPIAKSQGIKNADALVERVVGEIGKIATRQATKGFDSAPTTTVQAKEGEQVQPQDQITEPLDTVDEITAEEQAYADDLIEIENTRTGERKVITRAEASAYGIGEEDTGSDLPSKKDILAAMMLDLEQTGGKNLSKLNTLMIAYERVYGKSALSAQEKAAVIEATGGLNLIDEIETAYSELQDFGLTAQSGGAYERARGAIEGNLAAINQEGTKGAAAAAYSNTVEAFLSKIARSAGEKGVLTDQDIKRIKKAIPKFSDSPETAERQLDLIRSILSSAIETKQAAPIGSGEADEQLPEDENEY